MWERSELKEFQDAVLISNIDNYRAEFEIEWQMFHKCMSKYKYDHIIPGVSDPDNERELREHYITAYLTVITRCFGWGLPCTTLIPFADCINHHNVDSSYDMIHADWRPMTLQQYQQAFEEEVTQVTGTEEPILNFSQKLVDE